VIKTVQKLSNKSKKIIKNHLSNKSTRKVKGSLKIRKDSFFAGDVHAENDEERHSENDINPKVCLNIRYNNLFLITYTDCIESQRAREVFRML
jgi:hypothetical protein